MATAIKIGDEFTVLTWHYGDRVSGPYYDEDVCSMDTTKLIQITDRTHRDHGAIISRWRTVDAMHVEYRDGGVWSRLHTSQIRLVENF